MRRRRWLHFLISAGCWPEEFSCEGLLSVVLNFLRQLKRAGVTPEELMLFLHHMHSFQPRICMSHVPSRSPGLPQRGPGETPKTCIANYLPRYVIQSGPRISRFAKSPTLFKRREEISSKLFNEVVGDPGHTLHKLLPPKNPAYYFLRRNRDFPLPLCRTDRCKNSFIFSHVFSA